MATWRCERCGRGYDTPPSACGDCGHTAFDHGSAVRLRRPGGIPDDADRSDISARDWWLYALLFAGLSTGLLVIVGLLL